MLGQSPEFDPTETVARLVPASADVQGALANLGRRRVLRWCALVARRNRSRSRRRRQKLASSLRKGPWVSRSPLRRFPVVKKSRKKVDRVSTTFHHCSTR